VGYFVCVAFGGVVTLAYGVPFGPPPAGRDPLVIAVATLGLALILLGAMSWIWSDKARSRDLPAARLDGLV
jgi:branched-chain amino acid transport system permease protein